MNNLSPAGSLIKTLKNWVSGNISFPKKYNGRTLVMKDGEEYKVFRHITIKSRNDEVKEPSVFIVQFKLKKMSVAINRLFSLLPIPMFVGLPGFKAKFWMCNEKTGVNQGIYQWDSVKDAEAYSKSFAVRFMTKRSVEGSVKYKIIPNTDIMSYVS